MERNGKGQFATGNGGGPGRPKKTREERYLEITLSAVTFEDWKVVVKKAAEQAMRGDTQARKWLSDYLIGPPTQKTEITGANGGAILVNEMAMQKRVQDILTRYGDDEE